MTEDKKPKPPETKESRSEWHKAFVKRGIKGDTPLTPDVLAGLMKF